MTEQITAPHSRAAEDNLLGALIIDPEMIRQIALEAEDFYIKRNQYIYIAIQELVRAGKEVDYVTICTRLDEKKLLAEVGGPAYLTELIAQCANTMHADSYAKIIRERAERRKILDVARKLTTAAFDQENPIDSARSAAMDALARGVVTDKGANHISKYLSVLYDEVDEAQRNPQEVFGITTGLMDWDRTTYGLQKGTKILLSGSPGVGKSVLAAQVLVSAAEAGHAGALYELEMSGMQVVRRLTAGKSRVYGNGFTTQRMRQGKLTEEETLQFTQVIEKMNGLPIYISDASEMTTAELRADLMRLKEYHGIEVAVVDYEGLLSDQPDKDFVQRSTLISKRVHDIAKDLDICLLSISDMTKAGIAGAQAGQAAVAGTARTLHDADEIILMQKSSAPNSVVLQWGKNREGEADRFVTLIKRPGFPVFSNAARY